MALIILKQAMIMLLLILVGVLAFKTKVVTKDGGRQFSNFVLEIVTPAIVINAYAEVEFEGRLVINMLWTFALAALSFIISILASKLLVRNNPNREVAIERFSAIYSNCGFMGIPLASAMLGTEGVFYASAFLTIFFFFSWTHGIMLLTGQSDKKALLKKFCSPTIIGIVIGLLLFFFRIELPDLVESVLSYVSGLNTPMAMVASGISVAQVNMISAVKNPRVYYASALKLIILPLIFAVVLLPLTFIPIEVRTVVLILSAAPSAAMCTLQCQKHGLNDLYASQIFAMTTILSMGTLPLIAKFFELVTQ